MAIHDKTSIQGTRPGVNNPPLIWYPEWTEYAKCREYPLVVTDYAFFDHHQDKRVQEWAIRICHTCPVIKNCLQYGMRIPYGIFGGMTANQRWQLHHMSKRADKQNVSWYSELLYRRSIR